MIIIGELINGMYKRVGRAIAARDGAVIRDLASRQVAAGAQYLDINTGPFSQDPVADMQWLVRTIRETCDAPLSLDSTRPDAIEEALKHAGKRPIINSTTADKAKMDIIFALAKKYDAQVIGLALDKTGVPGTKEKRLEFAATIVAGAIDAGIDPERLYLDPIAMPVNVAQAQGVEVFDSIRDFALLCAPAPQTVIGLSNVSQGAKDRSLLNRTFLTMAVASGLTAVILDPLDSELMDALIAAELIMNKHIYCDSFLEAYRKR